MYHTAVSEPKTERAISLLREAGDPAPWRDLMVDGEGEVWPFLLLEDFSAIPFLDGVMGVEWYQLRCRTRAGDGDLFVSTQRPVPGYEEYNRDRLALGSPGFVLARHPGADPLVVADTCIRDATVMDRLTRVAEERGGLILHPYMGSPAVWNLAREVQNRTKGDIRVLAPPPPAVHAANHKGMMTAVVEILLGKDAVCRTVTSKDLSVLARAAREFAQDVPTLVLKIADYASAMGNQVFDSNDLASGTEEKILRYGNAHGWNGEMEILLSEWREDVLESPSTQLWIPPKGRGVPRVDGVFEQLLEGRECVFQGSMPSTLPRELQDELARMSMEVASVLQGIGYVGRCSFDFLLCGRDLSDARLRFVECNGRWGGTSIPMSLVDRIFDGGERPFYRARDYVDPALKGLPFPELAARLGDSLFDVSNGRGHFLLYNVGCLEEFGKFDVIALGRDRDEACGRLEEELPRRLAGS